MSSQPGRFEAFSPESLAAFIMHVAELRTNCGVANYQTAQEFRISLPNGEPFNPLAPFDPADRFILLADIILTSNSVSYARKVLFVAGQDYIIVTAGFDQRPPDPTAIADYYAIDSFHGSDELGRAFRRLGIGPQLARSARDTAWQLILAARAQRTSPREITAADAALAELSQDGLR